MKTIGIRYDWSLAVKLLLRAHRQRFIPLVAMLSVAGVALGVAALIVVLSVMNGFEDDLQKKITAMSAHLWVQPLLSRPGDAVNELPSRLASIAGVEAAGGYATSQALLQSKFATTGAVIFGLDASAASRVVQIESHLKEGLMPDFSSASPEIVLGSELADSLQVVPGDSVFILTAQKLAIGAMPLVLKTRVAGVFEVGMYEYDGHTAYLPLAAVRKLLKAPASQGAMVRTRDMMRAHEAGIEIQRALGHGYVVRDWLTLNRNLFFAIKIEKLVMFIIQLIIVTVAAFNITSSLIMTVMEKTRAIGILSALGVPPRRLSRIFMIQGALVGALGVAAGVVTGLTVAWLLKLYPIEMPGGGSVYYLTKLPVRINWILAIVVIPISSLALCLAAAVYPAHRATKLDPMEAIHYE